MNDGYKEVRIGPKSIEIPNDWKLVKIQEVANEFISGGTPSTKKDEYWGGDIPWTTNAYVKGPYFSDGKKYITETGLKNSSAHVVDQGNLLFGTRVNVGNVALSGVSMAISQDITGIILEKEKVDRDYIMWFLSYAKPIVKQFQQGSTIKGILVDDVKSFEIPLPPLPEQRRIAEILSTVDDAIQKTDEVIEKAERLKKGLMQDLLTKGIGHDEFKEVQIGPKKVKMPQNWEVKKLGGCAEYLNGYGFKPSQWSDEGLPIIRIQNLTNSSDEINYYDGNDLKERYIIEEGDLLVSWSATLGAFIWDGPKAVLNQHIFKVRTNGDINKKFFYFALDQNISLLERKVHGSTMKHITKGTFESTQLPLPPLPEQRHIAEILSSLDDKIKTEKFYKEKLKIMKKGLMQDLLTGKVRVDGLKLGDKNV